MVHSFKAFKLWHKNLFEQNHHKKPICLWSETTLAISCICWEECVLSQFSQNWACSDIDILQDHCATVIISYQECANKQFILPTLSTFNSCFYLHLENSNLTNLTHHYILWLVCTTFCFMHTRYCASRSFMDNLSCCALTNDLFWFKAKNNSMQFYFVLELWVILTIMTIVRSWSSL